MRILKSSSEIWKKIKRELIETSDIIITFYRKYSIGNSNDDPFIGETLPDRDSYYELESMGEARAQFSVSSSARLRNSFKDDTGFGVLIDKAEYVATALYEDVKEYYKEASHVTISGWGESNILMRILGTYEDGFDEPFVVWFFLSKEI